MMEVLFAPTGIAEGLHDLRLDWEGAGYITFPMPLLVAAIALYIRRQAMLRVDAHTSEPTLPSPAGQLSFPEPAPVPLRPHTAAYVRHLRSR
ncbi:hypothetical protein SAMN05443244_3002 [Terriglobus roseus]|uniref:Uncharacterized protein n=1 Tax=Terriglobus roseus TaxID=392734 RepID=A0A1H4QYR4_9BACT|nr:hypothetical protein SAMN05443244_3002 [Terriglobus roseus]